MSSIITYGKPITEKAIIKAIRDGRITNIEKIVNEFSDKAILYKKGNITSYNDTEVTDIGFTPILGIAHQTTSSSGGDSSGNIAITTDERINYEGSLAKQVGAEKYGGYTYITASTTSGLYADSFKFVLPHDEQSIPCRYWSFGYKL